ncbi:MAG: hypothetical protein QNK82_14685 [Akkermansiaceae bacterium]|jgi:hypothetical protein|nr:hypothetical protein [bacterium]
MKLSQPPWTTKKFNLTARRTVPTGLLCVPLRRTKMKFQFLTFKVVGNTTAIEISFDAKNLISNAIG